MTRRLTFLSPIPLLAAGAIAACGGGGDDTRTDDGVIDPDNPDGDTPGLVVDDDLVTGGSNIVETPTPEGFTNHDDGSGNASYLEAGFDTAVASALAGHAGTGVTADPDGTFFYPLQDTMVPWNLTFISFQWKAPDGDHDKILLRATGETATFHAYLTADCTRTGFCQVDLPQFEFQHIGLNNLGKAVQIDIISQSADGTPHATQPLTLHFSPDELLGALYYWASIERTIKRVSFGAQAATDFIIPGENVDYACISCHSVSRDGSTIAFGVSPEHGENISGIQVAPTSDPSSPYIVPTNGPTPYSAGVANGNTEGPTDNLGHNVALNPDGSLMAVNTTAPPDNWPSIMEIRNTQAPGGAIFSYPVGTAEAPGLWGIDKMGIHPEYSPDGSKMVVTLAQNDGNMSAWSNTSGGIGVVDVGVDGSLSNLRVVSEPAAGAFHFYPTWSPDSQYIAFMTSWDENIDPNSGKPVGSLGNDHAVMHMVPSNGNTTCPGAGCIELTRGTGYGATEAMAMAGTTGTTWPKFAPFAQGPNQSVYFITFTSRRQIGASNDAVTQLWMFGIDTSVSPDPSFSPFWLPYQDISSGSLTPYWTTVAPCDTEGGTCNGCLPEEICRVNTDTNECRCDTAVISK